MELVLEFVTGQDEKGNDIIENKRFITSKVKARMVRRATEITQGININNLKPEDIDTLVDFLCEVYKNKFTRDDVYDGLDSEDLIPTLTDCVNGVINGVTSKLDRFPPDK